MRNSTKLKNILLKYDVTFSLKENESEMVLILSDKHNGKQEAFESNQFTKLVSMAFSFFSEQIKIHKNKIGFTLEEILK